LQAKTTVKVSRMLIWRLAHDVNVCRHPEAFVNRRS
jgi:hypothetical protein